ncbi:MAG: beta-L-arabinofuranosidase domain-containing protein [Lacunisphaera sp.]
MDHRRDSGRRLRKRRAAAGHRGAAVAGLIATQTSDGYIGAYPEGGHLQRWDIWGRKYALLGLLAWFDATGDPAALNAAKREADFLLAEVGPGKASPFTRDMWNGMASGSVLEPMVLLYRRTGERRYLDFANYLVQAWTQPDGPDLLNKALADTAVYDMFPKPKAVVKDYHDHGKSKAYEMMSNYEGLLELYRVTGDARYLTAVKNVHASIRDTEITIIGSGSDWERWYGGKTRQTETWSKGMETCVTADVDQAQRPDAARDRRRRLRRRDRTRRLQRPARRRGAGRFVVVSPHAAGGRQGARARAVRPAPELLRRQRPARPHGAAGGGRDGRPRRSGRESLRADASPRAARRRRQRPRWRRRRITRWTARSNSRSRRTRRALSPSACAFPPGARRPGSR